MEKCSKTFFRILEKQNMQNQTISEVYIDDDNSDCSSNPKDMLKSEKTFYEKLTLKRKFPKLLLLSFLTKFLTIRNIQ